MPDADEDLVETTDRMLFPIGLYNRYKAYGMKALIAPRGAVQFVVSCGESATLPGWYPDTNTSARKQP